MARSGQSGCAFTQSSGCASLKGRAWDSSMGRLPRFVGGPSRDGRAFCYFSARLSSSPAHLNAAPHSSKVGLNHGCRALDVIVDDLHAANLRRVEDEIREQERQSGEEEVRLRDCPTALDEEASKASASKPPSAVTQDARRSLANSASVMPPCDRASASKTISAASGLTGSAFISLTVQPIDAAKALFLNGKRPTF